MEELISLFTNAPLPTAVIVSLVTGIFLIARWLLLFVEKVYKDNRVDIKNIVEKQAEVLTDIADSFREYVSSSSEKQQIIINSSKKIEAALETAINNQHTIYDFLNPRTVSDLPTSSRGLIEEK